MLVSWYEHNLNLIYIQLLRIQCCVGGGSYTNVQHSSWWARLWVEGLVNGSSGVFRVRVIIKQLGQRFRLEVHLQGFWFVLMVQCMLHDNAMLPQLVERMNRWVVNQRLTWMKKKWRNTTRYGWMLLFGFEILYSLLRMPRSGFRSIHSEKKSFMFVCEYPLNIIWSHVYIILKSWVTWAHGCPRSTFLTYP
jgi:hypothetical protein